jgi:hypothetical protein
MLSAALLAFTLAVPVFALVDATLAFALALALLLAGVPQPVASKSIDNAINKSSDTGNLELELRMGFSKFLVEARRR